jgi:hypothetical protein
MSEANATTPNQIYLLHSQLDERHHAILLMLKTVRVARSDQIRRAVFASGSLQARTRQCNRVLAELAAANAVVRSERTTGGKLLGRQYGSLPYIYSLGPAGYRLLGIKSRPRPPWKLGHRFLHHALEVADVYAKLAEGAPVQDFKVMTFEAEPQYDLPNGRQFKPDAFVRLRFAGEKAARIWFVEVDMGFEADATIRGKIKAYWAYRLTGAPFPKVLFLVPQDRRKSEIEHIISGYQPEVRQLFDVARLDDATGVIASPQ